MRAPTVPQPTPILDLNTTPLIDVMLVLLIMFIITIPIQTHAVKLDLPADCSSCPKPNPDVNMLTIDGRDRLTWNGTAISLQDLPYILQETRQLRPVPELHVRSDAAAHYGTVDKVLAVIKRQQVEKFGFVGNEAYREVF
jgi:biopolymer transport protein ExbD